MSVGPRSYQNSKNDREVLSADQRSNGEIGGRVDVACKESPANAGTVPLSRDAVRQIGSKFDTERLPMSGRHWFAVTFKGLGYAFQALYSGR